MNGPYFLKFDSLTPLLTPLPHPPTISNKYTARIALISLIKYIIINHPSFNVSIGHMKITASFKVDKLYETAFLFIDGQLAYIKKYSIMTQTSKTSFSVKQLITLLENPRSRPTSKRREILLDRQQIRKKMTLKWKDPGHCNIQFSKSPSMRAQILNQWELQRISLAERSYITPKDSIPYQYDRESREFPRVTINAYPKKFQRYLKQVQLQKQDLLFKEKRTVTQGRSFQSTMSKENTGQMRIFKPASTSTKVFGFSSTKPYMSNSKNKHFKTLNL